MREGARLGLIAVIGALVLFAWDRRGEQLARMGDVVGADAACEHSVMADAGRIFENPFRAALVGVDRRDDVRLPRTRTFYRRGTVLSRVRL